MASEIETDDPLAQLLNAHLARTQEISTTSLTRMQEISEHAASEFRRFSGLRSTALSKLLENAGIIPAEAATDAPE